MLKRMVENSEFFEWNYKIYEYAAKNNNLEMLQYAIDKNPRYNGQNKNLCNYAIQNNNLEMLKYLKSKGYPYDEDIYRFAIRNFYKKTGQDY